jgi:cyclopropane-fatty-acyl-phospholipid synthase
MAVPGRGGPPLAVAPLLQELFGEALPARIQAYDGSGAGPPDAPVTIVVRTPDALRRFLHAPGELGLARAYVAGDLDVVGDIFALLEAQNVLTAIRPRPAQLLAAARLLGRAAARPLPPPAEEVRLRGRRHSRRRDAAAIAHHYDVSNRFYELLLGPSMTYSCAVFADDDGADRAGHGGGPDALRAAQARKHELVCAKLALQDGQRLLDVGCGWGSLALHAARHHGARVVGVTLSRHQLDWARRAVAEAGLADRVEIRLQDYRDVDDGPYDAISSVGMFEHVGEARTATYLGHLFDLLRPGGRLLNHAISRPAGEPAALKPRSFVNRYVFPDGELLEVGRLISAAQLGGLEVRHLESLREHYDRTLRHWIANLERQWPAAVAEVGEARARVWRLYLAGSAMNFRRGGISVHQVLAVRATAAGGSGMPLRPTWETSGTQPSIDLRDYDSTPTVSPSSTRPGSTTLA